MTKQKCQFDRLRDKFHNIKCLRKNQIETMTQKTIFFAEHLSVILLSFKTNEDIYVMTNPSF